MYYKIAWQIHIGDYKLAMLDNVEIRKSVDLLADTCTIKIPATLYNKPIPTAGTRDIAGLVKRGDKVTVWLGYNTKDFKDAKPEFEGYMLNISTDDGSLVINCEDDLFLLRKSVRDAQFKGVGLGTIAEYLIGETGVPMVVNCSYTMVYDKFVISRATAYDVLKKISEETKGNIYIKKMDGISVLNIHPPYIEKHGYVRYSFQKNIESSDLKYKSADDKVLEVVVESTGKDGKKISVSAGKPGGDKKTISGNGMNEATMQKLADETYSRTLYDGFEGGITGWLVPYVEPGYSAEIKDEEYEFKNGWYYVKSVTTTCSSSGIVRKIELGIKLTAKTA